MKNRPRFVGIALVLAAGIAGLALVLKPDVPAPSQEPAKPIVAATFFPLHDLVRQVAGEDVDVKLVLPPGANPHTFDPTPSLLRELTGAQAVYAIGHGLDAWAGGVISSVGAQEVIVDTGIALRAGEAHEEEEDEHEEEGDGFDPHYWLTVPNAKRIVATVEADLSARFPEHADDFSARAEAYRARLDAADTQMRDLLAGTQNRKLVTFHDAWYYFADAYGFEIVGTFEPSVGREPTPGSLGELTRTVRGAEVRTIYYEPSFSPDAIRAFARDNGLTLLMVDPESDTGGSYIGLMLFNASQFAKNE